MARNIMTCLMISDDDDDDSNEELMLQISKYTFRSAKAKILNLAHIRS